MAKYRVVKDDVLMNARGLNTGDVVEGRLDHNDMRLVDFVVVVDPDGDEGFWFASYFEEVTE